MLLAALGGNVYCRSNRSVNLLPNVLDALKRLQPLHADTDDYVFLAEEGLPIDQDQFRKRFTGALPVLGIRPRHFYNTRHTYISVALTIDSKAKWVAEQCADSLWFYDGGVVLFLRWGQGAAKIARWIALRPARRYGVAEYLPAVLHRPVRRFQRAAALDPPQHGQEFGRFDFRDRPSAQPWEQIFFETPQNAVAVTRDPSRRELRMPLARAGLEGSCVT